MRNDVQEVTFKIEGEFITELARTWFWEEDKPYSTCEELLLECMMTDQIDMDTKKRLIVEILEGRKKLVGVNTFYLEDDNEKIRPLSQKIEEKEFKNGVLWVENEMQVRAIDFIDPYSTLRSIKALRDSQTRSCSSFDDCFKHFAYNHCGLWKSDEDDDYDTRYETQATKLGMWLFFYPKIAWVATKRRSVKIGSDAFWDNVYEQIKDWGDKSFCERNERYLADRRVFSRKDDSFDDTIQRGIQERKEVIEQADPDSREGFEAAVGLQTLEDEGAGKDRLLYVTVPDEIVKWEGLISPTGMFYSCTFGGHNLKAYNIMAANPNMFPGFEDKRVYSDRALDTLMEYGWCATRFLPYRGEYLEIPPVSSGKKPTKAQIDTIWEAIVKHDAHPDNMYLIGF